MLAYSSQLWIQRPLKVQKSAARFWQMTSLNAFRKHRLVLLCMCELGERGVGLQCRKNLRCESQHDLLRLIVRMANEDLEGGAPDAVQVELVSGQYPTHAATERRGSKLAVGEVLLHCGLDKRPGRRLDRTMMTFYCRQKDEPIKITNCHCPASVKRVWHQNARSAVLTNVFRRAGLEPFVLGWRPQSRRKHHSQRDEKIPATTRSQTPGSDASLGKSGHAPWRLGLGAARERIPNVLPDQGRLWRHL